VANEDKPPAVHATNKTSAEQDWEEVHAFVVGAVPARLPVAMTERVLVVQLPLP
jgi:hypothetical protein